MAEADELTWLPLAVVEAVAADVVTVEDELTDAGDEAELALWPGQVDWLGWPMVRSNCVWNGETVWMNAIWGTAWWRCWLGWTLWCWPITWPTVDVGNWFILPYPVVTDEPLPPVVTVVDVDEPWPLARRLVFDETSDELRLNSPTEETGVTVESMSKVLECPGGTRCPVVLLVSKLVPTIDPCPCVKYEEEEADTCPPWCPWCPVAGCASTRLTMVTGFICWWCCCCAWFVIWPVVPSPAAIA